MSGELILMSHLFKFSSVTRSYANLMKNLTCRLLVLWVKRECYHNEVLMSLRLRVIRWCLYAIIMRRRHLFFRQSKRKRIEAYWDDSWEFENPKVFFFISSCSKFVTSLYIPLLWNAMSQRKDRGILVFWKFTDGPDPKWSNTKF